MLTVILAAGVQHEETVGGELQVGGVGRLVVGQRGVGAEGRDSVEAGPARVLLLPAQLVQLGDHRQLVPVLAGRDLDRTE